MRSIFPLYYRPSEEEKKALFEAENCFFVFDTNALLDIYRLGKETAEKVLQLVDKYKERIVIPFHVAKEYHNRMMDIITELYSLYNDFQRENDKESMIKTFSDFLKLEKYPPAIKRKFKFHLDKSLTSFFKDIKAEALYIQEQYRCWELQNKIASSLGTMILPSFSEDEIKKIEEEGIERYNNAVPPGYKDKNTKDQNIYGDLIIWKEILKFAKDKQCSIIFISRDMKDDWVYRSHGIVCGPRIELLNEFRQVSTGTFYMYTLDQFITHANNETKLLNEPELTEIKDIVNLYINKEWNEEVKKSVVAQFNMNDSDLSTKKIMKITENKMDNVDKKEE